LVWTGLKGDAETGVERPEDPGEELEAPMVIPMPLKLAFSFRWKDDIPVAVEAVLRPLTIVGVVAVVTPPCGEVVIIGTLVCACVGGCGCEEERE
jgi:hypothetical protein